MDHRLGLIIMVLASPLSFAFFFLTGNQEKFTVLWLFFYGFDQASIYGPQPFAGDIPLGETRVPRIFPSK